ncbi:DUF3800 domain-containing protein [Kitasatospora sp. CMC57]|uniref:DUF3800 domain-containing protein n=1 Tax=Kitasatospora sp. CMC57 TaxID=3231513 RepID=A0AB33JTZ2_9ACTN
MSETSRAANAGTGLTGEKFSRRNQPDPTRDEADSGRWLAIDESGQDGDQLHGRGRYFVLGAVAIDDAEAAEIIGELRAQARIQATAPELKFQRNFGGAGDSGRRELLAALLGPSGPLAGRSIVYLVDKHYMISAKLVDLLIEEQFHAVGVDIVGNGVAREMARVIANDGPRGVGSEYFDVFLATASMFFSKKNRNGDRVTADELYSVLRTAATYARRKKNPRLRPLADLLKLLASTREHAEAFVADRGQVVSSSALPDIVLHEDDMEPLIPSLVALVTEATERFGRLHVLADDQKLFTDSNLDYVDAGIKAMTTLQGLNADTLRGELRRGRSIDHPSLQLADLVSGAGLAVARRYAGESSPAGDDLVSEVSPLILKTSLVPYDEPLP